MNTALIGVAPVVMGPGQALRAFRDDNDLGENYAAAFSALPVAAATAAAWRP